MQQKSLGDYLIDKKCMLIVNVASYWPFAKKNYQSLVKLYQMYEKYGLEIVAFPCNQFLNQEPHSNESIKAYVRRQYGVEFPLMDKVCVNGKETHDVFKYLRSNTKELQSKQDPGAFLELPWNFCRWVVDKNGKVQMYMNPVVDL